MKSPKVSVIVAVYNAEKTLPRCLDSLVAQTLQEIEFVCIDDGSSDNSATILDEYAAKDTRFTVYHKPNEGVSATRQFGIEHIHGEYVIHLDADDYAEEDTYKQLYQATFDREDRERADIVICNALRITEEGIFSMDYSDDDLSAGHLLKRMFSWETSALWNRLIRTELITKYQIHFPVGVNIAEDRYFLACLLNRSIQAGQILKIVHLDKPLIRYDNTANPKSLTNQVTPSERSFRQMAYSYQILLPELDMTLFGKEFFAFVSTLAFNAYWTSNQNGIDTETFTELFSPFKQGLQVYGPKDINTFLVILSLSRGLQFAKRFKFLLYPKIAFEKIFS